MQELFSIAGGLVLLLIGVVIWKAAKRAGGMSKSPTFSKSANRAVLDTGIYTEHGMVNADGERSVKAQQKRSERYYESFL